MRTARKKQPRFPDTRENWQSCADTIAIATAGRQGGSIRIDPHRLESVERSELVELTIMGKHDRRWEQLTEQAAGVKPGTIFQKARDDASFAAGMAELRRGMRRPARRVDLHEEGSVTLPREWMWDLVAEGRLYPSELGALIFLMAVWENGGFPTATTSARIEGEAIVVDLRRGGCVPDPDGVFVDERRTFHNLALCDLIEVEANGKLLRITPGPELKKTTRVA